ncbi:MAG: winged helix DNA-binding domain-containing protein [Flavipsychrobacter sp.]
MKQADIATYRLERQQLSAHSHHKIEDIVKYMGAMQAQDYAAASWALGLRLPHITGADVDKALAAGTIIRTHVMRPTWHFVAPKDLRWMLDLTAARVKQVMGTNNRKLDLDAKLFAKANKILVKALEGSRQLTRSELITELQKAKISTDENRFSHIMVMAELEQLVCSGGKKGKQFTYALLDERIPATKTVTRDEALAALAERYFKSHGPATVADFAWWSGLTLTDSRAGLEMIKKKLVCEEVDGSTYWFADTGHTKTKTHACLLPVYDEYVVAYKDRSAAAATHPKLSRSNALFNNIILLNGRVSGTWKRSFNKDTVSIELQPFEPYTKTQHESIAKAAKHYAAFHDKKLELL